MLITTTAQFNRAGERDQRDLGGSVVVFGQTATHGNLHVNDGDE
ncbi:hypothetical protein [Streptomyces inhibens]|nr:hypothetical protein [Streptomyces inhibens]